MRRVVASLRKTTPRVLRAGLLVGHAIITLQLMVLMGHKQFMFSFAFPVVVVLTLAFRIGFSFVATFGTDCAAVYERALQFYLSGVPATTGARIVYSGTRLPGALCDLIFGLPLFFAGGHPYASAIGVAVLLFLAHIAIFWVYRQLFPDLSKIGLWIFIFFAPWGYLYTDICNTGVNLAFQILVFLGLFLNLRKPGNWLAGFLVGFGLMTWLQVHLSFVLGVGLAAVLVAFRLQPLLRVGGVIVGGALGSVTLVPWVLESINKAGSSAGSSAGLGSFLTSNIHFDPVVFQKQYKVFTRFITFPTSEVTRFIGAGQGFGGALQKMGQDPVLLVSGLLALGAAVFLIGIMVRFFLRLELWRKLLKRSENIQHGFSQQLVLGLLATQASFLVSIKEPTAHNFYFLYPWAFYPVVSWYVGSSLRRRPWIGPAFGVYVLVSVVFSVKGYMLGQQPLLYQVVEATHQQFKPPFDENMALPLREVMMNSPLAKER